MSALADEFTTVFRHEHRQVRDVLLELIDAFEARDRERIGALLERTAALTGPHFRYEEETLYPALKAIFGEPYIDHLFHEHDGAIERAATLVGLAQQNTLSDADVAHAVRLVREILPHVSDCDGLSVMVEILPEDEVQSIFDARDRSHADGLDLLMWASGVRGRPLTFAG
jgi:hypothetical protein